MVSTEYQVLALLINIDCLGVLGHWRMEQKGWHTGHYRGVAITVGLLAPDGPPAAPAHV